MAKASCIRDERPRQQPLQALRTLKAQAGAMYGICAARTIPTLVHEASSARVSKKFKQPANCVRATGSSSASSTAAT